MGYLAARDCWPAGPDGRNGRGTGVGRKKFALEERDISKVMDQSLIGALDWELSLGSISSVRIFGCRKQATAAGAALEAPDIA